MPLKPPKYQQKRQDQELKSTADRAFLTPSWYLDRNFVGTSESHGVGLRGRGKCMESEDIKPGADDPKSGDSKAAKPSAGELPPGRAGTEPQIADPEREAPKLAPPKIDRPKIERSTIDERNFAKMSRPRVPRSPAHGHRPSRADVVLA